MTTSIHHLRLRPEALRIISDGIDLLPRLRTDGLIQELNAQIDAYSAPCKGCLHAGHWHDIPTCSSQLLEKLPGMTTVNAPRQADQFGHCTLREQAPKPVEVDE